MSDMYHVNPATNRPNVCRADKQSCPYNHFDSKEKAREFVEHSLSKQSSVFDSAQKKSPEKEVQEKEENPLVEVVEVAVGDVENLKKYIEKLNRKLEKANATEFVQEP